MWYYGYSLLGYTGGVYVCVSCLFSVVFSTHSHTHGSIVYRIAIVKRNDKQ